MNKFIQLVRIIFNEFRKEILITWSYKFQWFGEFLSLIVFYLFLNNLSKRVDFSAFSYCVWFYSVLIIGDISGKITHERNLGTFEQIYLSTSSIVTIFFAKIIASIMKCSLLMLTLVLLLLFYGKTGSLHLLKNFCISILLITPGLFGFSLIIGGFTLLLKDVGWVINIINNSALFLSGAFLSLEEFPYWLQKTSSALPTTQAINLMQKKQMQISDVLNVLFINLIYLIIAFVIFSFCEKNAKSRAILDHY